MENTDICIKKGAYRVEKNNFTILYEKEYDTFNFGVRNLNTLGIQDIRDLHNLTRRILKYIKSE